MHDVQVPLFFISTPVEIIALVYDAVRISVDRVFLFIIKI